MPSYDPPAAQNKDNSQMYHSRNIIEGHEQTIANTYTSVINELITIKIITRNDRQRYSTIITNLLICLYTSTLMISLSNY